MSAGDTSIQEFIGLDGTRIGTAHTSFYDDLCRKTDAEERASAKKKPFKNKVDLFPIALIIGVLNDKRDESKKDDPFARLNSIADHHKSIIKIFLHSVARGDTLADKWKDIKDLADGGIQIIEDEYKKTNDFDVYKIFADVNKMWPEKAKDIIKNLQKSS